MKKFIITEDEKKYIKSLYGLLKEQSEDSKVSFPITDISVIKPGFQYITYAAENGAVSNRVNKNNGKPIRCEIIKVVDDVSIDGDKWKLIKAVNVDVPKGLKMTPCGNILYQLEKGWMAMKNMRSVGLVNSVDGYVSDTYSYLGDGDDKSYQYRKNDDSLFFKPYDLNKPMKSKFKVDVTGENTSYTAPANKDTTSVNNPINDSKDIQVGTEYITYADVSGVVSNNVDINNGESIICKVVEVKDNVKINRRTYKLVKAQNIKNNKFCGSLVFNDVDGWMAMTVNINEDGAKNIVSGSMSSPDYSNNEIGNWDFDNPWARDNQNSLFSVSPSTPNVTSGNETNTGKDVPISADKGTTTSTTSADKTTSTTTSTEQSLNIKPKFKPDDDGNYINVISEPGDPWNYRYNKEKKMWETKKSPGAWILVDPMKNDNLKQADNAIRGRYEL